MLDVLVRNWWTFLVRGIAAIVFGVLAIALPLSTLVVLVAFYGAYALVDGVFALIAAMRAGKEHERWGWLALEGVVGIAAAAVTFFYPAITALVLLFIIAFWAILTGVLEIATAVRFGKLIPGEWALWLAGILSILFGVLLVARPAAGALAVVWLIGTYAIVFGAINTIVAFRLRQLGRQLPHTMQPA
jgi:uncharacterized membrane protein HdeD (DUF308 family)